MDQADGTIYEIGSSVIISSPDIEFSAITIISALIRLIASLRHIEIEKVTS